MKIPSLKSPVAAYPVRDQLFDYQSAYQRIRLFRHEQGHALFLNGTIQWESREEVLLAEDLPAVRLWVGNALRGLIPAVFVSQPPGAGPPGPGILESR